MKPLLTIFLVLAGFTGMGQLINIGSSAGDHTGDPLRTAFSKINAMDARVTALESSGGGSVDLTNILSSLTTLDLSKTFADFTLSASVTVTGISGTASTNVGRSEILLTNAAATNVILTLPIEWKGAATKRIFTVTNGSTARLTVSSYGNRYTNFTYDILKPGNNPYIAKIFLPFEGAADTPADAAWFNTYNIGAPPSPATWSLDTTNGVLAAATYGGSRNIEVNGVNYNDISTSCLRQDLGGDGEGGAVIFNFPESKRTNDVLISGWIKCNLIDTGHNGETFDFISVESYQESGSISEWAVLQYTVQDTVHNVHAHSSSSGGGEGTGPNISLSADTWYFFNLFFDYSSQESRVAIYNTSGVQLGTSYSAMNSSFTSGAITVRIGNFEPHGAIYPASSVYYDDVAIQWGHGATSPTFPVAP